MPPAKAGIAAMFKEAGGRGITFSPLARAQIATMLEDARPALAVDRKFG